MNLNYQFGLELEIPADQLLQMKNEKLLGLIYSYKLIIFKNIKLDDKGLLSLANKLGNPLPSYPIKSRVENNRYIRLQKDGRKKNYDASYWHCDRNWCTEICDFTLLKCVKAPLSGGATLILDAVHTAKTLQKNLHEKLSKIEIPYNVEETAKKLKNSNSHEYTAFELKKLKNFKARLIINHPHTKEKTVSVTQRYIHEAFHVANKELINELFNVINSGVIHKYYWAKGDVLIWDNFATLHKAGTTNQNSDKITKRIVIKK